MREGGPGPGAVFGDGLGLYQLGLALATADNATVMYDASENLEWIQLEETRRLTPASVGAALGQGLAFDGWRFASRTEVTRMFEHGGLVDIGSSRLADENYAPAKAVCDLLLCWNVTSVGVTFRVAKGFIDDTASFNAATGRHLSGPAVDGPSGPDTRTVAELRVDLRLEKAYTRFYSAPADSTQFASFLVRTGASHFDSEFKKDTFVTCVGGECERGDKCQRFVAAP